MGLFGGIKDAKYSEGGVYIVPGVYRLQVVACKQIRTRTQKDAFVAEFKVLESSTPERPPGSAVSWMLTFDKEPAMGNLKQFLGVALKHINPAVTEDQIDESVCEYVVSAANPLGGIAANPAAVPPTPAITPVIVRCSAANTKTKANRDFTKCKFFVDGDAAGALKDAQSQAAGVAV
jgi:hypothetical protein